MRVVHIQPMAHTCQVVEQTSSRGSLILTIPPASSTLGPALTNAPAVLILLMIEMSFLLSVQLMAWQ